MATSRKTDGSVECLAAEKQSCDGGTMCLELALEGERLCMAGDCRAGVAFFLAAIQAGTDDLRTLSAIYSQLGNAYFFLGDYHKAMVYHRHDLTLARTLGDALGEAKASGNLGNTLKVMGRFREAVTCCERHLDIAREMCDKLSEGRALYNLGNVYHAQGKHLGKIGQNDPGHMPEEVRTYLLKAMNFYEANLSLMRELGDMQACGRACGNLGNTCYLLGDFKRAIEYHNERLQIAQEFNDRAAERRANSNLANAYIFLGQFEAAAQHYQRTLALAIELGDSAVEAQACYSLGNTFTLLRDYQTAEVYHSRHMEAARRLNDRVGEGRACWSLGNAHAALGNHEKALYYASKHYEISKELGDSLGMATARMNMTDLRVVLGLPQDDSSAATENDADISRSTDEDTPFNKLRVRRQSMEQLSLLQLTPEAKQNKTAVKADEIPGENIDENQEDNFLDLLSKCQSERMNDQRATMSNKENLRLPNQNGAGPSGKLHKPGTSSEAMSDMSEDSNVSRNDSRRSGSSNLPRPKKPPTVKKMGKGSSLPGLRSGFNITRVTPEDDFLDMIARVQSYRLEDQRTVLPPPPPTNHNNNIVEAEDIENAETRRSRAVTVPDEDFFSLVMRVQGGRMDDQRATIPLRPVPPRDVLPTAEQKKK